MRKEKIVIATVKSWNIVNAKKLRSFYKNNYDVRIITGKRDLSNKRLKKLNPRFVFFPHWSWIIPKNIYKEFECVVFHMTDLPFGRGGSPLQNLIERGVVNTKISAIRVDDGIDTGPIYLKRSLNLNGKASDIFIRFSEIVFKDMITHIVKNEPCPVPQKGKAVEFKRRTPSAGNIANMRELKKIYDHIRMLDAEGYPPAFIETGRLKIELNNAILKDGCVSANARIIKNEK
jgi:methionyl-tRNA formyltransferase